MNGLDLLADEIDGRLFVAVVHNGQLTDLYVDPLDKAGSWASLYVGKITKIDQKLDAAFVDLGSGVTGLLPAKHVRHPGADVSETRTGIGELLRAGQSLLVQVKSEGKQQTSCENNKLPRLTMKLYLPGLFLAYSPTSSQVTMSRELNNEKILSHMAGLRGKGGWIVQRSAENAGAADIDQELAALLAAWEKILAAQAESPDKPRLLKAGPHALARALTDYAAAQSGYMQSGHIYAGNKKILDLAIAWSDEEHLPALAASKRLRLFKPEKPGQRLFDIHDVYSELEALKDDRVPLNAGGAIIIERTAAMTVIDVNQENASSPVNVNRAAAQEIARQSRLRNLSGAILVDFIGMQQKTERQQLLEVLEEVFAGDMMHAQVHGFTRLGIVEMTRKRRGATLAEKLVK